MTNFQRLATVRTRFIQWLQNADQRSEELGPDGSLIQRESMLIRDEFFCGRKFHAEYYTAVWFIEEDVLKIHRADGSLELVLRGSEIDVSEVEEIAVDTGTAANAAVLQLQEQPVSDEAIAEHSQQDSSNTLVNEPRILKLTSAHQDASESDQSPDHVAGSVHEPQEHKNGGTESGEQEIRKAA